MSAALLEEATRLEARANELAMADLPTQAYVLRSKAADLRRKAGLTGDCTEHVWAFRAAKAAADRTVVLASVNPRLRAALEDIAAGVLPPCHLRPTV